MSNTPRETRTFMAKKEELKQNWFLLDAAGKTLGRFASEVAKILRGKHKPLYTPHADCGDGVVVINADKIRVTGNKAAQKIYRYYTGYIGGMREVPYATMKARKPEYLIEHAVKGMMPLGPLSRAQAKRLRVFAGNKHDMEAQQPLAINV